VRASERYLVLEFGFSLNQGCSGVGTAFPHLFLSTAPLQQSRNFFDTKRLIIACLTETFGKHVSY